MGSFIGEFCSFLRVRKKFWLAPMLITTALFGALLIATQGSAIAPKSSDADILVADYPILPSRRRFWERVP